AKPTAVATPLQSRQESAPTGRPTLSLRRGLCIAALKTRLVVPEATSNPRPYNGCFASQIFPFRICTGSPNEKCWKPEQPVNRGGENAKSPAPADRASNLELY